MFFFEHQDLLFFYFFIYNTSTLFLDVNASFQSDCHASLLDTITAPILVFSSVRPQTLVEGIPDTFMQDISSTLILLETRVMLPNINLFPVIIFVAYASGLFCLLVFRMACVLQQTSVCFC